MADKIKVTAGDGRLTPIDPSVATAPGGHRLFLKPGDELDVDPANTHVVRALADGDLVRVTAKPAEPEPEPEPAPAPAEHAASIETHTADPAPASPTTTAKEH